MRAREAVPTYTEALNQGDAPLLEVAAEALGTLGDEHSVPALIRVNNCSRIGEFQYVMVVNGQDDRGCAPSLVCVADWSRTNTSSGMM